MLRIYLASYEFEEVTMEEVSDRVSEACEALENETYPALDAALEQAQQDVLRTLHGLLDPGPVPSDTVTVDRIMELVSNKMEQARAEGYQRGVEEGVADALGGKAAKHYQEALRAQGARRLVHDLTDAGRLAPAHYREWARQTRERLGYTGSALEEQLTRLAESVETVRAATG